MRVLAYSLTLCFVCLLSGCALFDKDKKNSSAANGNSGSTSTTPRKDVDPLLGSGARAAAQPPAAGYPAPPSAAIFGYVLDEHYHSVDNAHILLTRLDGGDRSEPVPVDVDKGGFFSVQKLKPGQKYQLTTRARLGDRVMVNTSQVYAPNSNIVIHLTSEEQANAEAPPPGPAPGKAVPAGKTTRADSDTPTVGSISVPLTGQTGGARPSANPGPTPFPKQTASSADDDADYQNLPVSIKIQTPNVPGPAAAEAPPANLQPLGSLAKAPATPPTPQQLIQQPLNIYAPRKKTADEMNQPVLPPGPALTPPPPISGDDPPAPNLKDLAGGNNAFGGPGGAGAGSAQVPSCQMANGRLVNFALRDVNGDAWEFRQHKGKLVLLDFWSTTCPPCLRTIPKLCDLKNRYRGNVEIIGIACERSGSPQVQAQRVNRLCHDMHVSYRQLLCSGNDCPVVDNFHVDFFPTLVLLDDTGKVLWRHSKELDRAKQEELERLIQRHLNLQP